MKTKLDIVQKNCTHWIIPFNLETAEGYRWLCVNCGKLLKIASGARVAMELKA